MGPLDRPAQRCAREVEIAAPARASRFVWSGAAAVAPQLTTFLLTRPLLGRLGHAGFGAWVLILTVVVIAATSDLGLSGSITRFLAVHRGSGDRAAATRLVVSALVSAGLLVVAMDAALLLAGRPLIRSFVAQGALREALLATVPALALLIPAAVLNGLAAALSVAQERFRFLAAVTAASCVGYLIAVLLTVHDLHDLRRLTWLAAIQAAVSAAALLAVAVGDIDHRELRLLRGNERREFTRYAWRTQLANSAALINTELDAVIIAALLPIRMVGFYAVGAAVANAVRGLPLYAVPPLRTGMSASFGSGGPAALLDDFRRRNRVWVDLVIRYSAVTVVNTPYCVLAWLGRDFKVSAIVATILVACFAVNVTTAVTAAFVQAMGRADLEARYGIVAVVTNLVLTIPLAVAFGVYGVVIATGVGAVGASLYFYWLVGRAFDLRRDVFAPIAIPWSTLAVAALALVVQQVLLMSHIASGLDWLAPALVVAVVSVIAGMASDASTRRTVGSLIPRRRAAVVQPPSN